MYAEPNTDENYQGRWVDIGFVSDLGTAEETIEWLDHVYADTTISKDPEEDEFTYNGHRYTITEEGHITREAELGIYPDNDNADLETASIMNEEGAEQHNVRHEAAIFVIWPNAEEDDETNAIRRLGENVRVQAGDEELADGPYEMGITLKIEGKYWFEAEGALNDGTTE